jgi:predicted PhzF superfamily epimerase YddE/YHI9
MRLPYYQVNAFTRDWRGGNPAGVCFLEEWLPDPTLQAVAAENNLSETAFVIRGPEACPLRWFTPSVEVDLCGHATLAPAWLMFAMLGWKDPEIRFQTRSGELRARWDGSRVTLDFPSLPAVPCAPPPGLAEGLGGAVPREVLKARDYLAVFGSEEEVRALRPDFGTLETLDTFGVIATAPGRDADFVSRFFAPRAGVPEDPVTGSAHCTLAPYWAERFGRRALRARQLSARGGEVWCEDCGGRTLLGGEAVIYSEGVILSGPT